MEDLSSFDAQLADRLSRLPAEYLPMVRRTIVCSQPMNRAIALHLVQWQDLTDVAFYTCILVAFPELTILLPPLLV